eukprot:Skav204170  [mRNA]  locus=scaffold903:426752:427123:+ [translate_table: standard]
MRKKILDCCKMKVMGMKKLRFGEVESYEPVLESRPSAKNHWADLGDLEKQMDKETSRAAFQMWRFSTTGQDGLEEQELLRDAFQSWKSQRQDESENFLFEIFNYLVSGVGTFLASVPCCGSRG